MYQHKENAYSPTTRLINGYSIPRRSIIGAVCLVSIILYLHAQVFAGPCDSRTINHHTYSGEGTLQWQSCGEINGRRLECTRLEVPMDQFNATNSKGQVFSLPIVRLRGNENAKNMLINPGGPGGSGHAFIFQRGGQLSTIVGDGFHLVGFDPRGVNGSIPQALCYADLKTRNSLAQTIIPSRLIEDSPRRYAHSKSFVEACLKVSGEHGKYINTPQTAADMNSIMDALCQEEMIYWGFSYGTILGQTYASLFPKRSHRIMIDGVGNVFNWFDTVFGAQHDLQDADRVVRGLFEECIKAGEACPLAPFGATADELHDKIFDFTLKLKEQPLSVYINETLWGVLTADHVIHSALFPATYKPAMWWTVADHLARMLSGNATDVFLQYGIDQDFRQDQDDSNQIIHNNDAQAGLQHWPSSRLAVVDLIIPVLNRSMFMVDWFADIHQIQNWLIPKTHNFHALRSIKTVHPLFIASNTYDPVTPLAYAKVAHETFAGSGLVEIKAFGHGSIANPSKCFAKHLRAFLYDGIVPSGHVKCDIDGHYFVKPGTREDSARFGDLEEQAIHRAQVEIAEDNKWPYFRAGGF